MGILIVLMLVFAIVTGVAGVWIADAKGRSMGEGFLLGFFLSVLGLIIEVLLPKSETRVVIKNGKSAVLDKQNRSLRKCPFCAEMILAEAKVCRYCQRELPKPEAQKTEETAFKMQRTDERLFKNALIGDKPSDSKKPISDGRILFPK